MSQSSAAAASPNDIQPVIPLSSSSNWGMWGFFALIAVGGLMLFQALSASEEQTKAPSVFDTAGEPTTRIASPAPLRVPERFREPPPPPAEATERVLPPRVVEPVIRPFTPPPPTFPDLQNIRPVPVLPRPTVAEPEPQGPQVVFEQRAGNAPLAAADQNPDDPARVTASRFRNPSRTIPQGTVIQAVLETALDSTQAGGVRALVQRDVSSFDGSRTLIPRGSRLYGEYAAALQRGQNRALVQWTRLIRPDGVTIALDSPSSDPLGRAGIKGKVDSKFLQRFGGAILQSVLDIGVGLAVNQATDGLIVALPGSTQNVQVTDPQAITPTLKVKHGTSVSVFVARDLDFSTVES